MATSALAVEVITLPVNDVDRALRFYLDQVGFALPGLDPADGDYASFADFAALDGNTWILQERGFRQTPEQG